MLGHRLAADRQLAGQGRGGRLPSVQEDVEHLPAGGLGDRRPEFVGLGRGEAHPSGPVLRPRYFPSSPSSSSQPRPWLSKCRCLSASGPPRSENPLSTTLSRVERSSERRLNSTRVELPSPMSRPASTAQRKEKKCGGSTRSTRPWKVPTFFQ